MQRRRARRELRARLLQPRRGGLDRHLGAGELRAARAAGLGVREHRRDRAAVLALEPLEHREALLDGVQAAGLGVEALGVRAQLAGDVVDLVEQGLPALGERVECGVDALGAQQAAPGGGEQARDPDLVGARRLGRGERCRAQRLDVTQALAFGAQVGRLLLAGLGGIDLRELEVEQVELALARAGQLPQLGERRLRLARHGVRRGDLRAAGELRVAAEAVEDVELSARERELAVLVLAVERDERLGQLAQVGDRRRAAVDERARAAVGADAAGEHDLVGIGRQALAELAAQGVGQLEDALDVGLRRARPDDAGLRATAEQQVERVGEHGLARAGLAGQHVEPAREPQLGPLDEQEVLDTQLAEHCHGVAAAPDGSGRCGPFVTTEPRGSVDSGQELRRPNFARSRL